MQSQFQLQRTVEGLSIIAISYYLIGIQNYALWGPPEQLHWNKAAVVSILAPLVVVGVLLMMRNARQRF